MNPHITYPMLASDWVCTVDINMVSHQMYVFTSTARMTLCVCIRNKTCQNSICRYKQYRTVVLRFGITRHLLTSCLESFLKYSCCVVRNCLPASLLTRSNMVK
jgi:hypothetical protein